MQRHGRIIELTASDLTRQTIDAWVGCIEREASTQPNGTVLYWLQDISASNSVTVPTYMRERLAKMTAELVKKVPDTIGHNAIVLPRGFISLIARIFINSLPSRNKGVRRLFFKRDEALKWLETMQAHEQGH